MRQLINFICGIVGFVAYYAIVSEYFFDVPFLTFIACLITAPLGILINFGYLFSPLFADKILWGVYWAALIPFIWFILQFLFAYIKRRR